MKLVDKILNNLDENKKELVRGKDRIVANITAKEGKEVKLIAVDNGNSIALHLKYADGEKLVELPKTKGSIGEFESALKKIGFMPMTSGKLQIQNENSEQLSTEEMYDKLMSNWKRNPPGRRFGHAGEYYKELKKVKIKNISDREESMIKELWSMYGSSLS